MKRPFVLLALLSALQSAHGDVPWLFKQRHFTAVLLAEAVNHFVTAGEENAVKELEGMAPKSFEADIENGFSISERIGWVCRVIFVPKPNDQLRPPFFGGLRLPYLTMPADRWPMFPVARSGSTYFILDAGYSVAGMPETAQSYIQYCRHNGLFRKTRISVPTRVQAIKDAESLRQSGNWNAIKWADSGPGWTYTMDEESTFRFINEQAQSIP